MEGMSLNRENSKSLYSSTEVDVIELQSEAEKPVEDFILIYRNRAFSPKWLSTTHSNWEDCFHVI